MELKIDIAYEQVLHLAKQLPFAQRKQLLTELENSLFPYPPGAEKKGRPFGVLNGHVWMAPDFDEPLEGFKDYF